MIMSDLNSVIVPGLTNWEASNRFFAYFKPHSSYPAVMGELVCAGLNVMGFDWIASPAATELEVVTCDWLCKLLRLPSRFLHSSSGPGGGVFQDSAGSSATVVLLAALKRAEAAAASRTRSTVVRRSDMVVYASDQTHTIVKKACIILGVGTYRELPTSAADNWGLQAETLRAAIVEDLAAGRYPVACVATAGTTSSCAFDDIAGLATVCAQTESPCGPLWLHIDAAYVSRGLVLPRLCHCRC